MTLEKLKFLSRDIICYGAGNSLYTMVQFICLPIVIRSMSMSEVANWNLLLPTGVLLSAFITFGMDSTIVRFVIDKEEKERRAIFSTGLYFVIVLAFLVSVCFWLLSAKVTAMINLSGTYLSSYWMLLCWLPGVVLCQFLQNWLKYTFERARFISVIALQSGLYLICIMYLKLANKIDLQNVMLASLISIWLPALLGLFYSSSMIIFRIDRPLLGRMLAYGAPLMIMTFGFNMIFSVDKYILSGVVARDQFAVYSQAFRIAAIFSMLVSSFNFAFGPLSLSLFNKAEAPAVFAGLRTYYLLFMCLMGMIFIACGRIVILLLAGREYVSGCAFLAFFVMGYILYGLFSFGQMGIIYSKKSYLNLFVLVTGLVMTVVWDMLLVRHIKGYGTAAGFFLGNLTMVLLASSLSKRYLAVGYSNTKDIIVISFFAVFGAVSSFTFFTGNFYIDGLVKTVFGATLFCAMIMLPLFRSERALFKQVLSRSVSSQAFSEG